MKNAPARTTTRAAALAVTAVIGLAGLTACGSSDSSSGSGSSSASASDTASSAPSSASPSASASSSKSASPSSSASASKSSGGSMASMIMIKDYKYATPASVKPGATVMIMNEDSVAHTVTADSGGAFDVMVPAGKTVTMKAPAKSGSYAYHCDYHSNMHGVLKVG